MNRRNCFFCFAVATFVSCFAVIGGLTENIPRVLPKGCAVVIQRGTWNEPPIFELIRSRGAIEPDEMARVFNLGIGLVLIVAPEQGQETIRRAQDCGDRAFQIGIVEKGERAVRYA